MKVAIGIDLGGTNIKAALVSEKGEIIERTTRPTCAKEGPQKILSNLLSVTDYLISRMRSGDVLVGIGMGSPGWIDSEKGVVLGGTENLPGWAGTDVASCFKKYNVKFKMDNDVNVVAIGEHRFGAARGRNHVLVVTLGTGIGGGLILNGKLYRGAWGYAGEIGHTTINFEGPVCNCGTRGCMEAYAGAWAVEAFLREVKKKGIMENLEGLEPKHLEALARSGDRHAVEIFRKYAQYVAVGISNAVNLLNVEMVVVGGGIAAAGELLFEPLRQYVRLYTLPGAWKNLEIVPAALGNDAGVYGAVALVLEEDS